MHDPADPVPSLAHPFYPLIDPPDDGPVGGRDDVLRFTTGALIEPLDLAGPVTLTVRLSSSAPSTHLMATLVDLAPDGITTRILEGAAAAAAPWPRPVTVDLGHAGYRVRPGHRLALHVASSAFPAYVLHPGTDADPWTATAHAASEQTVVLGGSAGATLTCFALTTSKEQR